MKTKTNIIRWWGLIPFLVIVGLIAGFVLLFLDGLIESTIEEQGSRALGAQVDVGSVKTSLLDQSITLRGIEIANADKLDENIVQIGNFTFNFDLGQAMSRKLIIDELTAEGIAFNTKRKTPAKPVKKPVQEKEPEPEKKKGGGMTLPGMDLVKGMKFNSPAEILKNEKLETLERVEQVKQDVKTIQQTWKDKIQNQFGANALDELKKKVDALQQRAKNISGPADVQAITADIQSLRGDIEGRINEIKNLKTGLEAEARKARALVSDLKDLPKKDFERLKKKYSLDLKGGVGLVAAFIKGPFKEHLDTARRYYEKARPYLKKKKQPEVPKPEPPARGKGVTIEFLKPTPVPDLLVRHGRLSLTLFDQQIAGDLKDLSDNQKIHGRPMRVTFDAANNPKFGRFNLDLTVDRTGITARDTLKTRIESLKLSGFQAGDAIKVEKGGADIQGSLNIVEEQALTGDIKVKVRDAALELVQAGDDEISKILKKTLATVDRFYINFLISGTLDETKVDIESDLNQILDRAIRGVFEDKAKEFEDKLRAAILDKTKGPLAEAAGPLSEFKDLQQLLNSRESSYENLLSQVTKKALIPKLPGGADQLLKKFKLPF